MIDSPHLLDLQSALAGEYSLERELGRGGMGVVYLARDVQLDRQVAIKVLLSHVADTPVARERFLREARTAAGLSHPHIVPIHRVGEAAGHVYFVMAFVPGETLGERIRRAGPLPAAEAMRMLREVAWALAYAHGRGIVHRDVKPDNILLEEGSGRALVTDFGIAQVGATTLETDAGRVLGTAQFMSPEQAMNEAVDGRSDLYALGAVGYVALSGQFPFEASSVPALLFKQVSEAPRPVGTLVPGLPRALVDTIGRCLAKAPDERFPDGEALAAALAPTDEGRGTLPSPLRAWLSERNPATIAYAVWSGVIGIPFFFDVNQYVMFHRSVYLVDMIKLGIVASLPLVPMLGFHANRAKRLFAAGYTLADLRGALDVGDRERGEQVDLPADTGTQRALRLGTFASLATAMVTSFFDDPIRLALELRHVLLPFQFWQWSSMGAWLVSLGFLVAANMTQVRIMPRWLARLTRGGVRESLWRSRLGEWIARRLGAPDRTRATTAGVFQATESALGLAAADLFAALPSAYREQLAELPAIVDALEARASAARADVELLDRLASDAGASSAANELFTRRASAKSQLGAAVASLETIRIDLLRLHAGASDLQPLTTLIDEARELGRDVDRLAAAQREVLLPPAERRVPTPV